jgi:hypothetical protein
MLTIVDRARLRRRRMTALLGGAASLVVALVLIHIFYRPLDVLWAVALRRVWIEV